MSLLNRFYIAISVLLFGNMAAAQQLKLGNNPYVVNKSAVLELNSDKQGFLLPRLTDTVLINALNPPDGMTVYFIPTNQFLLRANGYWNALSTVASLSNYWSTSGNSNGVLKRFGTVDNFDLPFISSNIERMRLTAGGRLGIGTVLPSTLLHISGTNPLTLNGVQIGTTTSSDSVLTINNGTVQKLPVSTFQSQINGTGFVKASGTAISYDNNTYTIANTPVTAATKTKITYDAKGLVTAGSDATTSDIAEGTNLYYTDARVRNTPLTGFSTATATAVIATDNVLAGVGKLQGQINSINSAGYLTTETDPLAAKKTNNLSDLVNIATARINLGATTVGSNFFTLANPSAVTFPRINGDNSVSALDAATFRSAIGAGTGGVSSVSVVSANGFAGSVATSSSTPAITLSTTVTGLLKGNSVTGAVSAAIAGTDYQAPIALPYTANRYYNGYGNFVGLNTDSIVSGSTNLFVTATEKSTWNAKEGAIIAPYTASRYWNGYKQFAALNTDSIAQGSTNLFYTDTRVRAAALTGLSTATATAVTATDNLLAGVGKLQGQINSINTAGYLTGNQSITWSAAGDASGSASGTTSISPSLTITGLRGAALPALSTGLLKYTGTAWTFDNNSYLTSETSTLANVTGRGNTTATGISLTQNGNIASSFSLYTKRNTDVSPLGNLIQAQNAAATTDLFKVDASGNTTATSFVKSGGTASQFLKADGSVDNTSYLAGNQTVTLSGDVSGTGTTAITTSIGANKVTLNHLAQIANGSFLGRTSVGTGNVEALTTAQAKTLLGLTGSNSGDVTLAGQNYLSLSGQTITANAIDLSGTHAIGTLAAARFGALTGDVTNTAGSYATTIANGAVTYSKMQNISANNRLLGRATTGVGSPEEITIGSGLSLTGTTLSANGTGQWSTVGNSGTSWTSNFLGTTDNASLRFRTNNLQRFIVDSLGNVGIGVNNPGNPLVVKDTLEIRRTGTLSTLLFSNTAGSGDLRIAGDGGDLFWQGGGGRSLQMGSYWGMVLSGDRQSGTLPGFSAGSGGIGVLIPAQRAGSVPLVLQAASAQTANLSEWRNSANTILNAVSSAGNLGLGTASPTTKLHVVGTNPLTLNGVQLGGTTTADSLLTINNGTVQKLPVATFVSSANTWSTTGNSGINSNNNFLGSTNNADLRFRTNNIERMAITNTGNVGIGSTSFNPVNPEQLLVDAGATTSFNLMTGKGTIDNYLQINVQNKSATANASSDIVATADNGDENGKYIDLGINSSLYSNTAYPMIGGANTAYLYGTGNDFVIGNATANQSLRLFTGGYALTNERLRIDGAGNVGIGTTVFDGTNPEKFFVNAGTTTSNNLIKAKGSINSFLQLNLQNTSTGIGASSDIVATADNGTDTTNYVDFGINGSGYTGGYFGSANDGYLYNLGQDFLIGNGTVGKTLNFLTGGGDKVANTRMTIDGSGDVGIGTTNPIERLHVVLSTGVGPTVNNIMTVETNNTTATSTSATPNITFARQLPSFAASSTYPGANISFGFRTAGTINNFAQIQTSSAPTASRVAFYTRTGMTNANPATGTLAENMVLDGKSLGIGTTTPGQSLDVNGDAGIQTSLYIDKANANTGSTASGLVFGGTGSGEVIASKRTATGNQYGLDFYTASANRMTIINNGNIGIGTTTPADKLSVAGIVAPTADAVYTLGKSTLRWNTTYSANGVFQTSDRRLKTNIGPLQYGLKEVMAMQPVHYNWKTAPTGDLKIGLIAQEIKKLVPEVVSGNEATENLSMNYAELVPVLVNAIKEQQKQIEDLKGDMTLLKEELMRMKTEIKKNK